MSFFEWLTIFFVCLIGAMTPGPSLIVIIYLTNSKDFVSGFVASLAHGFGIFIYALISEEIHTKYMYKFNEDTCKCRYKSITNFKKQT